MDVKNLGNNYKTNQSSITRSNPTSNPSNNILNSKIGEILKGQIIDIKGCEITIKFDNGEEITANLTGKHTLSIGDIATLEVQDRKDSTLILKNIDTPIDKQNESTLLKALDAAKLPINDKNIEIVKQLINNQMGIDKQSITNILKETLQFPKAEISTIINMIKNNIPLTEENISQYEQYKTSEHRISETIKDLSLQLPEALRNAFDTLPRSEFDTFFKDALAPIKSLPTISHTANSILTSDEIHSFPLPEELKASIQNGNVSTENLKNILNNLQLTDNPQADAILNKIQMHIELSDYVSTFLTSSELSALNIGSDTTLNEFVQTMNHHLSSLSDSQLKEIIHTSGFEKLVSKFLKQQFLLTPDEIQEGNVKDHYNNVYNRLKSMETLLTESNITNDSNSLKSSVTNLKSNLEFMDTMNQMLTYLQLPVKLKDTTIHSELFVYTNKKELKKNKGNISVLLHLDMDHLGPLDVHVNLQGSNLATKFYVDNDVSYALIEKNLSLLEDHLLEKGYLCKTDISKQKKQPNLIKDFIENDTNTLLMKRYSFDLRA